MVRLISFALVGLAGCAKPSVSAPGSLPPILEPKLDHFAPLARAVVQTAYNELLEKPFDADRNGRLGLILQGHEMYSAAISCYERAEVLAPDDFRWPYLRARCTYFTGTASEVLNLLKAAAQLQPQYEPLLIELGECLTRMGQWDEARSCFEQLTTRSPGSGRAWLGLGRVWASQSKWVEAETALSKAVELAPRARSPRYLLGMVLMRLGRPSEAEKQFAALNGLTDELPMVEDEVLAQAGRMGIGREAMEAFKHAGELEAQGQWVDAKRIYEEILKLNPEYVPALCQLGTILGRQGDFGTARKHLEKARGLDPSHAYSAANLGWVLAEMGQEAEAVPLLKNAIELDPYLSDAYLSLSVAYRKLGQVKEAMDVLHASIEGGSAQPMTYLMLAEALLQGGQRAEAVRVLREGVVKGDSSGELARILQQIEQENQSGPRR